MCCFVRVYCELCAATEVVGLEGAVGVSAEGDLAEGRLLPLGRRVWPLVGGVWPLVGGVWPQPE
jgi:hypothetical protein